MMVVVAIFTIISSIAIFRQSEFSSDIVVTNLAYEIALEVRQAQTYGIGVRNNGLTASQAYQSGYGVHLGGNYMPNSFVLFADTTNSSGTGPNDGIFQDPKNNNQFSDVVVDTFHLPGGNQISDIFYTSGGKTYSYKNKNITSLDITFVRPQPDALIIVNGDKSISLSEVSIVVASSLGDKCKEIDVYASGQISVNPTNISCAL